MKLYLFLAAVTSVFVFGIYYSGYNNGRQKCRVQFNENITQQQANVIKIQGEVHETLRNSGGGDIRRVLREKYTIAE